MIGAYFRLRLNAIVVKAIERQTGGKNLYTPRCVRIENGVENCLNSDCAILCFKTNPLERNKNVYFNKKKKQ